MQGLGVFAQPGEVAQRVDAGQLAGMDQAHEEISHIGPSLGFVEQGIFAIQNGILQGSFTDVIVERGPGDV